MDHLKAVESPISTYFGTAWFLRWIIYTLMVSIWLNKPRTIYSLSMVLNLIFVVLTALSLNAFHKPNGMLILVEEVLITLWHFFQLLLFVDLGNGGKFKKGGVWALSVFIFMCYLGVILIELALLGLTFKEREYGPGASAQQQRKPVQGQGVNGLAAGNGVDTMKKDKSGIFLIDGKSVEQMPAKIHGQSVPKPSGFDAMGF